MEYSIEDRINMYVLKNHLLKHSPRVLMHLYGKEDEDYCYFIDTLNITLDAEPAFFLVEPQILKNALEIVYKKRFAIKDSDVNAVINEIIAQVNRLNSLNESDKNAQKNAYLAWQEESRCLTFSTQQDFLNSLSYDTAVLKKTSKDRLDDVDPAYFLASVNHLAENFPEFYQQDPARITRTLATLEALSKTKGFSNRSIRAFAKETIKTMQKVKGKEE